MKTIMICLEKMGIGGVETSVMNQALEYKRRGKKVLIVAKEGIYTKTIQDNGIFFEDFEFDLESNYNMEKANSIRKLIDKYGVNEVIINQFPCILSVMPACYMENIPYIAYLHTATKTIKEDEFNVFDWFENQFDIYKYILKNYFKNAKKIIAISQVASKYVQTRYNIPIEKFSIIKNSINLELYKSYNNSKKRERFLLISRLSNEKLKSIKNGIDIFNEYENENKILDIVGDGESKEEVLQYAKGNSKINFLGNKDNIQELMDNYDIVLGLDRTILEAITMKKIAVIIGYENPKQIISKSNIAIEADEGFSGNSLEDTTASELANRIKENDISIEYNYDFIEKNLNIQNNIYMEEDYNNNYNYEDLFCTIENIERDKEKQKNDIKENNMKEKAQEEINNLIKENKKLKEEINSIYNSKRFKFVNNIANLIKNK